MEPNVMRPPQYSLNDFISALPKRVGTMVEIGCYQGESTEEFAKSGKFDLIYAVDIWSNEVYDPNDQATLHCDMAIVEAAFDARMAAYGTVFKIKKSSVEASEILPCVDMVYLDGNHTFEAVSQDIAVWRGKTKILAGHDYGTHPGVKKAVDLVFGKPDAVFKDFSWVVYL